MTQSNFSYMPITAAISSEIEGIDYPQILDAVVNRDKLTFLKLMWQASAGSALASQQLEQLENDRQILKKQLDTFSLALTELQNAPAKNLTEEQYKQRLSASQELAQALTKLKENMRNLDREITYLNDYNEDMQKRFREKMVIYLKKIEGIHEEKVEVILNYLKQQNRDINNPELRKAIKEALNSAEVQEAYLKSAGQDNQSFLSKLKGWFK